MSPIQDVINMISALVGNMSRMFSHLLSHLPSFSYKPFYNKRQKNDYQKFNEEYKVFGHKDDIRD